MTFDLPEEFIISKFYELGYRVKYSKYNDTYNCACPICREGKSFERKKRCYYLPKKDLIYCHNCGWSSKPYKWIRKVSGQSDAELRQELDDGEYDMGVALDEKSINVIEDVPSLPEDCINLFDDNQVKYYKDNNIVRGVCDVIKERKLRDAVNCCRSLYVTLKDRVHRHRLIIPFFDTNGDLVYYQSRKVFNFDTREKYISKIGGGRTIFNLDRVSTDYDDLFIFEGPLDSMFVRNGVAVGGITEGKQLFSEQQEQQAKALMFFNKIWVLDSQWLDSTSLKKSEMLLKQGHSLFIWPKDLGIRYKDFNETCVQLNLNEISSEYIKKNTFKSFEGVLKLSEIKKLRG